jgi:hypothetical protein
MMLRQSTASCVCCNENDKHHACWLLSNNITRLLFQYVSYRRTYCAWHGHGCDGNIAMHRQAEQNMQDHVHCQDDPIKCDPMLAMATLHMLSRGQPPPLRLRPQNPGATEAFEAAFERLQPQNSTSAGSKKKGSIGMPLRVLNHNGQPTHVLFVPIYDLRHKELADGQWVIEQEPCFWAYHVAPGSLYSALFWINKSRMPVVLDLDDTLVVASAESSLQEKRHRVRVPLSLFRCTARRSPEITAKLLSLTWCSIAPRFVGG